ncbi:MAG: metallopeptidase TldD-related protein [Desulfurococcaceae archaeon]
MKAFIIKSAIVEETLEVAYRDGSIEDNRFASEYSSVKLYTPYSVVVASAQGKKFDELESIVMKHARTFGVSINVELPEQNFYKGSVSFNNPVEYDDALEIIRKICSELKSKGFGCESIFIIRRSRVKHIVEEYGVEAIEDRWLNELYVYSYAIHAGQLLSTGLNYVFMDKHVDISEDIVEKIQYMLMNQAKARRFNPVYSGPWIVVLKNDAACSLYHEIAHLLEADEPLKIGLNTRIGDGIRIYEDPFYPGPLRRLFDDEVYPAWRRTLIEDGFVVDYLRSRLCVDESKAGNGRGLFTKPKSMYHQLVVKPGDWSLDEAENEFKKIIVVENIIKAETYNGLIRIFPEIAVLKDKERVQPVKSLEVAVPIAQLNKSIIGLGEEIYTRFSYEKNLPIYDVAPLTIIEMRVRS